MKKNKGFFCLIVAVIISLAVPFSSIKPLTVQAAETPALDQPIGYTNVDLLRNSNGDSMPGDFVDSAIYGYLNSDAEPANDVDLFFNDAGSFHTDLCAAEDPLSPGSYIWSSDPANCQAGLYTSHGPMLLTYANMLSILPDGYSLVVGTMTGAQVLDVLNQSAELRNGALQPAGIRYKFYSYKDNFDCGDLTWQSACPTTWAWGAYDVTVFDRVQNEWLPLDVNKVYSVGTNSFLVGGASFSSFSVMKTFTTWGDMLTAVDSYVTATYGTPETAFKGPSGDGSLDGRIVRDGDDSGGSIIPVTVLHNNDSHGNLLPSGTRTRGMDQLAYLVKQERQHNPDRTLLLNAGDQIQGDSMMFYFRDAGGGFGGDGTPLPEAQQINPMVAVMNAMGYDAMTPGNHEFNFGGPVFVDSFSKANFPILAANLSDSGAYGLSKVNMKDSIELPLACNLPSCNGPIKVGILGLTNHRVPVYEIPSNIPGLTFTNPITTAAALVPDLRASNDVVLALTHIGNSYNPNSVDVDVNVDTYLAAQVPGIDAIIGGHSHSFTLKGSGPNWYLPETGTPGGESVVISQAGSSNSYLNEVVLGLLPKAGGGYEVVTRAGKAIAVNASKTPEDPEVKALIAPFVTLLNQYTTKVIGQTTAPIDARGANMKETNGGNLQADASVFEWQKRGVNVDFHLSGPMTSSFIAQTASPTNPYTLTVADMFTAMGYENNLVVISMNGPQIKRVLERSYRNYYYYKYVPGSGGYENASTCFLDVSAGGKITYVDTYPRTPDGNNILSLEYSPGKFVDFNDETTFYNVSTANYLAAGSCNFNDNKQTIWPLDQTQTSQFISIRDAVIDYVTAMKTISPAIEGRMVILNDALPPVITINSPATQVYLHPDFLTLDFSAVDAGPAGLKSVWADLDGVPVTSGQVIDLYTLALGEHTLTVYAMDNVYNQASQSVTFSVSATVQSLVSAVHRFYAEGKIDNAGIRSSLVDKLNTAQAYLDHGQVKAAVNTLQAFIKAAQAQSGKHIQPDAVTLLVVDANWVIANPK